MTRAQTEAGATDDSAAPADRVLGILITYRRNDDLRTTLEALARQTRPTSALLVVDNAADPACRQLVELVGATSPYPVQYLASSDNLGPAGGIALGMQHWLGVAAGSDWLVVLDDDNPPRDDALLAGVHDFARSMRAREVRVGGVGLVGARLDRKRGRLVRFTDDELAGPLEVDYVGGGQLPFFQVAAVRDVGVFDGRLFFGFDDLEFGLRLRRAGWSLWADGAAMSAARSFYGRQGLQVRPAALDARRSAWRDYYALRNLLHLLLSSGCYRAALRVSVVSGLLKPLAVACRQRSAGRLALAVRALVDAWTGRLGRRVEPVSSG